jgi:hypothetical protein
MTTIRSWAAATTLALTTALLFTTLAGPVMAAKSDRQRQRDRAPAQDVPAAAIETIRGERYRLGRVRVARNLTRIRDAAADQLRTNGEPAVDAPAWTDITAVYMARARLNTRLFRRLTNDHPRGSAGTFHGRDSDWSIGDDALFVAIELAEERPDDVVAQQVEIGFDGGSATPVQAGTSTDTRAGVEVFTLGGRFSDGSESAGTTDVSDRAPDGPIDYYNARSGVFGFYDPREHTYYLFLPERRDATSLAISLRSVTDAGEILDRLELPGGGRFVALGDATAGFHAGDGAVPLGCRSLSTTSRPSGTGSGPTSDGEAGATTTILYRAGVGSDPESGEIPDAGALLAALEGRDTVPMRLQRLDEEAEPLDVDGVVTLAPALGSFSLAMDVPPGQWTFAPAEGKDLVTPAGEALIDHVSLTGRAGVRTGEGLDGFVSGDEGCGRWELDVSACELVPAAGMAALVAMDAGALEQAEIVQRDGSAWCVGRIPDTRDAKYIVRVGRDVANAADLQRAAEGVACEAVPVELGLQGLVLDCSADGFERYLFLVAPTATADRDADAGLIVSLDMVVDPSRPVGERYDGAAALQVFGDIATQLASTVTPGG